MVGGAGLFQVFKFQATSKNQAFLGLMKPLFENSPVKGAKFQVYCRQSLRSSQVESYREKQNFLVSLLML